MTQNQLKIFSPYWLYFFIIATVCFLLLKINNELKQRFEINFNVIIKSEVNFFEEIKKCNSIGWFNLKDYEEYKSWKDYNYICFQNMIAPTLLENYGYNKKIICFYSSPIQLYAFCKKNIKYRLVRKGIFNNFALLERED